MNDWASSTIVSCRLPVKIPYITVGYFRKKDRRWCAFTVRFVMPGISHFLLVRFFGALRTAVVLFWWHTQGQVSCMSWVYCLMARSTVPQWVQNGSARVNSHNSFVIHYCHEVLPYPLRYWAGDSVATHFVSGRVCVLFTVCTGQGVVVCPSHESFTFDGG